VLAEARSAGTTLGGIVQRLDREASIKLMPVVSAAAPPGGLVDHCFYASLKSDIHAAARTFRPDAVVLELHGAMGTPELPDAEGDLLAALRDVLGDAVPIGVGLDLHADLTLRMLEAADICIACKENPHSDVVACGEKIAEGVLAMLAGSFRPVQIFAKVPMVLPGAQETAAGPLRELHDLARTLAAADPAIWDVSLYNVYRALDDADMGQAVVVVSNGFSETAAAVAGQLAQGFWDRRERFVDDLWSIHDALARAEALRGRQRFALADMGDRVLAGAPGDSTAILAELLLRSMPLCAAIPVTDPQSVARAKAAGVGAELEFELGGRLTPGFRSLSVTARVVTLTDGVFRMRGPYQGGEESSLGDTAVLRIGQYVTILATSRPGFTHDPEAFEANGVAIADQDVIVVKSGYHFALNFAGLATPLLVRTPGIGYYTKGMFTWIRGHFWPEHDLADQIIKPIVVSRRASSRALAAERARV
jgi:microcystin degradation protein MlrC